MQYSVRRTTPAGVTTEMPTVATITTTHNSSHQLPLTVTVAPRLLSPLLLAPHLLAVLLTLTLSMAVTRTISPCGMLPLLNNKEEASRLNLEPSPSRVRFDSAHAAETSSIDACLHDRFWTLLDMTLIWKRSSIA